MPGAKTRQHAMDTDSAPTICAELPKVARRICVTIILNQLGVNRTFTHKGTYTTVCLPRGTERVTVPRRPGLDIAPETVQ